MTILLQAKVRGALAPPQSVRFFELVAISCQLCWEEFETSAQIDIYSIIHGAADLSICRICRLPVVNGPVGFVPRTGNGPLSTVQ